MFSCAVQVKLELGHRAQVRKKPTVEGFTHDWMVFVRGPEHSNIQHFVEKVVFHLHESFPRPKRDRAWTLWRAFGNIY
uniref:YEATS domain-containing protein n=2 Tax=Ursus TaxID=9639 RepID=A0A452UPX2_URSMA